MQELAFLVWRLLMALALPLLLLRLLWRSLKEPLYRRHMAQRLAWGLKPQPPGRLWLHAVSLGETRAAAPLIEALRQERPGLRLLLTHTTATGRAAGQALLREGDAQAWLPFDRLGAMRRFLRAHQPSLGVLMETEVWPAAMRAATQAGLPVVLANARLSERSLGKAQRLAALMRPAAAGLTLALAQTEADAQRLRAAGCSEVRVAGNLKFDVAPPTHQLHQGGAWREACVRSGRPVVLAASTREGEEAMLLEAWKASGAARQAQLLIVPRHPQRFDEVAALIAQHGFALKRRSEWGSDLDNRKLASSPDEVPAKPWVWLGDSLGEMALYYALSEVALLGGSFAPLGGQNLIEAAACGCPIVLGPHTFNFVQAAQLAVQAGVATRVQSCEQAVTQALAQISVQARGSDDRREQAQAFARAHQGAAAKQALACSQLMLLPSP